MMELEEVGLKQGGRDGHRDLHPLALRITSQKQKKTQQKQKKSTPHPLPKKNSDGSRWGHGEHASDPNRPGPLQSYGSSRLSPVNDTNGGSVILAVFLVLLLLGDQSRQRCAACHHHIGLEHFADFVAPPALCSVCPLNILAWEFVLMFAKELCVRWWSKSAGPSVLVEDCGLKSRFRLGHVNHS